MEDLRQAKQHVQVLLARERRAAATAELESQLSSPASSAAMMLAIDQAASTGLVDAGTLARARDRQLARNHEEVLVHTMQCDSAAQMRDAIAAAEASGLVDAAMLDSCREQHAARQMAEDSAKVTLQQAVLGATVSSAASTAIQEAESSGLVGTEDLRQAKEHVQVLLARERRAAAIASLDHSIAVAARKVCWFYEADSWTWQSLLPVDFAALEKAFSRKQKICRLTGSRQVSWSFTCCSEENV
jgi:hypothetical protein